MRIFHDRELYALRNWLNDRSEFIAGKVGFAACSHASPSFCVSPEPSVGSFHPARAIIMTFTNARCVLPMEADHNSVPLPVSDERLLERAKTSAEGVAEVYDAYADRLYGFLLSRCGHKETAEDLVSKVFIKFVESLPKLEWRGVSLGAWLFRVATNALTDHWRSAQVRMDVATDESWDPPAPDDKPAWYAEMSLEKDKLLGLMKELSPRDQEVLDLRFFASLEPVEIAKTLQIKDNHASVLLYRALGRLRTKYLQTYAGFS